MQMVGDCAVKNGCNKVVAAGQKVYLIGAGGIGMSGLAKLLQKNGITVSGSDQSQSPVTDRLNQLGIKIIIGHKEDNLAAFSGEEPGRVVISAAVKEDNPELVFAKRGGCRIYKYARMLGLLMDNYDGIAVAGTHGKSTTSGWLVYLLKQLGIDTNFVIGADISQLSTNSGTADSNIFIAEACEYDRSFLNLKPKIGCILNIEADHLDYYKNEGEIVDAFRDFALRIRPDGVLIANGDDPNVGSILKSPGIGRYETFGFGDGCDFRAKDLRLVDGLYTFDVLHNGSFLGAAGISLPGRHNVLNALAVTAMAVNCGLDGGEVLPLLGSFKGMDRRIMFKGRVGQITVLDDYAHHPTEIRASLEAIRQKYQPAKLWCVFQPHQYSRTRFLLDDFAESFRLADVTIVPEIYFVRDSAESRKEVNAQVLVEHIHSKGADALFIDSFDKICDYLVSNVRQGELVVTMGAGDIWKVADGYIQRLGKNS